MKNLTKKVVILKNFSSPYVSQAIIVLKDYNPKLEGRAVADAEMIVSRYIERLEKNGQPSRTVRKSKKLIKLLLIISAVCAACALIYYLRQIN